MLLASQLTAINVNYALSRSLVHSRAAFDSKANFEHLIDATCGLLVLLSAQFWTNDFGPGNTYLSVRTGAIHDGMDSGIGEYFRVGFPSNWPDELRYDFNWHDLAKEEDPFQSIDYSAI